MKKRVFIALPLSDSIKTVCEKYQQETKVQLEALLDSVRFTPKENLHITACFLGPIEEKILKKVELEASRVSMHTKPFSLKLNNFVFAPLHGPKRMIWAICSQTHAFTSFVEKMNDIVSPLCERKIGKSNRETIPHITIARFRILTSRINYILPSFNAVSVFVCRSCVLYESRLTRSGHRYAEVSTFSFKGI